MLIGITSINNNTARRCFSVFFILSLLMDGVSCIESVSVNEGDSVTLHTSLTDIQRDDFIEWRFGDQLDLIAIINRAANKILLYDASDGRFKGRLSLNDQTGDLTITNIRSEHTGVYHLQIIRQMTTNKRFNISGVFSDTGGVKQVPVMEGDIVTLHTDLTHMQKYDKILWVSEPENTVIAEINRVDNFFFLNDTAEKITVRKLHLGPLQGDLTIRNIGAAQSGLYQVNIISSTYSIQKRFNIIVFDVPKPLSVKEGGSVTLHTDVQGDHTIWWTSGTHIAEIDRKAQIISIHDDVLDGRFRDRLQLSLTGSLTITNLRGRDTGLYHLEISDSRHTLHKMFTLNVCGHAPVLWTTTDIQYTLSRLPQSKTSSTTFLL
ncbi:uncharacterized protein LOC130429561 isoform X2 [Triplophysa dalaica]|uniref:uncharacterized protein LOC130429561 isoform X2 n=1 Tax=Triplophysa dalaica TaxID=1582913 RepID=UPI0024DFD613|nr:uncharacterized protein LOC130429561 isoform X2 [Triplophysa dalaica]